MAFDHKEQGQGLTEYAFLISFVVLVVIVVLVLVGQAEEGLYLQSVPVIIDTIYNILN